MISGRRRWIWAGRSIPQARTEPHIYQMMAWRFCSPQTVPVVSGTMTFTWSRGRSFINGKLTCGRPVGLWSSRSTAVAAIMKKSSAHSCRIYEIRTSKFFHNWTKDSVFEIELSVPPSRGSRAHAGVTLLKLTNSTKLNHYLVEIPK